MGELHEEIDKKQNPPDRAINASTLRSKTLAEKSRRVVKRSISVLVHTTLPTQLPTAIRAYDAPAKPGLISTRANEDVNHHPLRAFQYTLHPLLARRDLITSKRVHYNHPSKGRSFSHGHHGVRQAASKVARMRGRLKMWERDVVTAMQAALTLMLVCSTRRTKN